jgi:hypothetical protein
MLKVPGYHRQESDRLSFLGAPYSIPRNLSSGSLFASLLFSVIFRDLQGHIITTLYLVWFWRGGHIIFIAKVLVGNAFH